MKRLLFISTLLLISFSSFAQTFTLQGKVTRNEQPLPETSVKIKGTNQITYTDFEGNYQLKIPEGNHQVIFTYGNQKTIAVHLTADQTLDVDMTDVIESLNEILISAFRVDADSPITHSNLSQKEIRKRNLGQDVPTLMNYLPNVVTTSDAGAGIGYTGMRVRGSDSNRINVTINGIPINDAESQGTFWVNLGDFTSSIEDLQLQRGVGTSTNGAGAFGASLNVLTEEINEKAAGQITNTFGSFNTRKHQVQFSTGKINEHFSFSGNFSKLKSDGYRDRAFSDMTSYFLQGVYQKNNTSIKALSFGGKQQTYQAYYGISKEEMKENRKYNPAGLYTDEDGNVKFYDNQTDNYKQNHLQLLWNQKYNQNWSSNLSFHYTAGAGYYESYKEDADLESYGLPYFENNNQQITTSDLVNEKWLDNYFYGSVFNLTYKNQKIESIFGGGWSYYSGDHFGKVIYTKFAENPTPFSKYYDNLGTKKDMNLYAKLTWNLSEKFTAFADMQWRNTIYKTDGPYEGQNFKLKDEFNFFNPKVGLTYKLSKENQLYFSYARANKEPNRSDYKSAILDNENPEYPKAEELNDFELGWRLNSSNLILNTNLYFMYYENQLVLTGEIDPEGRSIRKNSGESYRAGIEIDANLKISDEIHILPNIALSTNKNKNYKALVEDEMINYGKTKISFSPEIIIGNQIQYAPLENLQFNLLSKFIGEQYMSNTEEEISKLDSYFLSDFNIQYTLQKAKPFDKIIFSGLINNIFNKKYVSNGYYSSGYEPLYYPQAGINFLAGITLAF